MHIHAIVLQPHYYLICSSKLILEGIKQLYDYFCKNNLLCAHQYSYGSKQSTKLATIKLVDYLVKNMEENFIPCAQ